MKDKTCLVIYIGNGYSENYFSTGMSHLSYSYSVDMRENWNNHFENVYNPLMSKGDRKSTRLNSSHVSESRMPSSA